MQAEQVAALDEQFVELVSDEPPEERTSFFASVIEAVAAHDRDFEDFD
jgi:hypothetical protein